MPINIMFVDGANKKCHGMLMRDIGDDFALGNGHYPETIEDALQVLSLCSDQKSHVKRDENEDNEPGVEEVPGRSHHHVPNAGGAVGP